MVAQKKYAIALSVFIGAFVLATGLLVLFHSLYNSSVQNDLQEMSRLVDPQGEGKPLATFDQLPLNDDMRIRQIERGYTLVVAESYPPQIMVCGKTYEPVWAIRLSGQICRSTAGD